MPFKDLQKAKECARFNYLERKKRAQPGYEEPTATSEQITLFFAYNLLKLYAKSEYARKKQAEYYSANPEKKREDKRRDYQKHREKRITAARNWVIKHPEIDKARKRKHYTDNRQEYLRRANLCQIKLRKTIQKRLRDSLSARIYSALKIGSTKSARTLELLGCSIEELRDYLEKQFSIGMTWENYGFRGWHIDHKKPCASFDLSIPEEQKKCFHFTNLQPLWMEDNFSKGRRYAD